MANARKLASLFVATRKLAPASAECWIVAYEL